VTDKLREESPLNSALRQFEAAEANLGKLENLWVELVKLVQAASVSTTIPHMKSGFESLEDVLEVLPKINGWKPESVPRHLNSIAQSRFDARECGEVEAVAGVEDWIEAPGRELARYRHALNKNRRQLVRAAMSNLIAAVDDILRSLSRIVPKKPDTAREIKSRRWEKLKSQVQEIETLLGSGTLRPPRWSDLRRHLYFGAMQDLRDIIQFDWPEVKAGLTKGMYDADDPIPMDVADLSVLAAAQPTGEVVTQLKWRSLNDEAFERLLFSLLSSTRGYENAEWLTRTNAPDRGRDLSVTRIVIDPLSGTTRNRVLVQCRHWTTKSISPSDVATLKEQIATWEPPRVDVLIIATTGRFTSDAVAVIEKHNASDRALKIEMWPESHLERLLAERPALIAEFRLR
jgi:hypothetical protein